MRNSLFKFKSYAFVLLLSLSLFSCDSNDDDSLPEVEIADKEKWLDRVNGDIISLRNAVLVVQEEDSITNIQIVDNSYVLEFVKNEPVKFSYISKFHIIISYKLTVYIVMCFCQGTN